MLVFGVEEGSEFEKALVTTFINLAQNALQFLLFLLADWCLILFNNAQHLLGAERE